MKRSNIKELISSLTGLSLIFLSTPAQNHSLDSRSSLKSLYCIDKREFPLLKKFGATSNNRSTSSVLWRLGRSAGFSSLKRICNSTMINPMAYGDSQFHFKKELAKKASSIIDGVRGSEDVLGQTIVWDLSSDRATSLEFQSIAKRMNYSPRCVSKFAGDKNLGPLGLYVKQVLDQSNTFNSVIDESLEFSNACPGYASMNREQKKNLWIFLMMSMSNYESSCKELVFNEGPNGIASGLLQLHDESENLYAKNDPEMSCDRGVSRNAKQSLKCGLSMIAMQIDKRRSFFTDQSHWQVLRYPYKPGSEAFQIRYAISQIKECRADAEAMKLAEAWKVKPRRDQKIPVGVPMEVAQEDSHSAFDPRSFRPEETN